MAGNHTESSGLGESSWTIWCRLGPIHDDDAGTHIFPYNSWLGYQKNWSTERNFALDAHHICSAFLRLYGPFAEE